MKSTEFKSERGKKTIPLINHGPSVFNKLCDMIEIKCAEIFKVLVINLKGYFTAKEC